MCNPCFGKNKKHSESIDRDKSGKPGFKCPKCKSVKRQNSRVYVRKEVWWCKNCCRKYKNEIEYQSSDPEDYGLGGIEK